jgi:hypothetical protein
MRNFAVSAQRIVSLRVKLASCRNQLLADGVNVTGPVHLHQQTCLAIVLNQRCCLPVIDL